MTKKELKKCSVQINSGYAGNIAIDIYDNETGKTIAKLDRHETEQKLSQMIRGGLFEFTDQGRKYQYIKLK